VHPPGGGLGLLRELNRDALGMLTRCARDYGDLVPLRLGLKRIVLISHPRLVEEVLVTRSHDFRKNLAPRLRSSLGNGLLVSEGDFWLRQRRLMQPAFHRQRIDAMAAVMVSTVSECLDRWRTGERHDIYREMMDVSLQIVARTLFGTDVTAEMPIIRRSSRIMTEHLRSRLFTPMMLVPDGVPTPGNRRHAAAVRDLDGLIYRLIAERRRVGTGEDLLGMLLAARDATGRPLSDRQVRDEVLTVMSAGYDTTALALTWAWVLLARTPVMAARMRAEIDAVLGDRPASAADVSRLHYVGQVVAETLRLYPSAWAIMREAARDTSLGGQRISGGTTVLLSLWVLHRDPRWFDEPEVFRPERWSDGFAQRLPRFAYLPFGGGQHACLGSPFAQLEITLLLATIAQRFHVEVVEHEGPLEPVPVLTLQPNRTVGVRVWSRV
jgi:cytochrome P450